MPLIRTRQVIGMPVGGHPVACEDVMFNPEAVVLVRPDAFGFSHIVLAKGTGFVFPGTVDEFRSLLAETGGK